MKQSPTVGELAFGLVALGAVCVASASWQIYHGRGSEFDVAVLVAGLIGILGSVYLFDREGRGVDDAA